jgi:O-methyltransferase involved in polyketide biosynthesis
VRNIKARIEKLEGKILPKASRTQVLYVPKSLPREDWDQWIADHADGRPLFVFLEGLSIEECMATHGVVEVSGEY